MANKNPGVGRKTAGTRMDQQIVGRESMTPLDHGDEYGSFDSNVATPRTDTTSDDNAATRETNPQARTREIRAEIEQTREEMSETVNTIQERLRPSTIASNAADKIRETASEGAREIVESQPVRYARANTIPTAMVGIGLAGAAWLAFGGKRPVQSRYRGASDRYYVGAGRLYKDESDEYDADAEFGVSNRGRNYSTDLRRGTDSTADYGREGMVRAQNQLQQTWDRNPLLMGAAAGILGAVIGSLVPESDRENELMGPARDNIVEGVEQAVQNKVEQVQNAATNAVNEVQKAVGITSSDESPSSNPAAGQGSQTSRKMESRS
jgi:hypothetical protein